MSRQPADANPSRPVRQHSGDHGAMFAYIVNGGDELALTKASLEHALGLLGFEIAEGAKLRAVNADMLAALQGIIDCDDTHELAPSHGNMHGFDDVKTTMDLARAAIAKATGT